MASNHTQNFHLSQWEADDEVLRADFNADNAAIEAALSAVKGAYTPDHPMFVTGTYVGNADLKVTEGQRSQTIRLGFAPRYVHILDSGVYSNNVTYGPYMGYYSGGATREAPISSDGFTCLELTEDGFVVSSPIHNNERPYPSLNITGRTYAYVAFR